MTARARRAARAARPALPFTEPPPEPEEHEGRPAGAPLLPLQVSLFGKVTIVLHGEPQGKGRPRFRIVTPRNGPAFASVYTPAETRAYEDALKLAAKVAMRGRNALLQGPLGVLITATMSVPRSWPNRRRDAALAGTIRPTGKPDFDNLAKTIDALNEVVWDDDAQIVDARILKFYGERPQFRIEAWELSPGE